MNNLFTLGLQMSETGLKALGQCGILESVHAGQAQGVTDAAVATLCEGNLALKSLVLPSSNCKLIR